MSRILARRAALVVGALVLTPFAMASGAGMQFPPPNFVAGFVRLVGVPGTSQSKPGWIEVSSLAVACDASRRAFFTYRVNETRTGAALREALSRRTRVPGGNADLGIARYELTGVVVTGIEPVAGDIVGRETVTLNFATCVPN